MSVTMITFCLGFCQILLFVRVLSDRFPVYSVTSCPQNDIEWRKASERLNCSLHYNKKLYRYHCLPDSKLTNLVEFCYDHIRPLVPKGNCVVLNTHSTLLDTYNCSKFKKGCPDVHFDSDAILKYPSCLLIDTKIRCYMAENTCITVSGLNFTAKSIFSEASTTRENKEIHDICLAAIIISIFVVLLTPGVIWFILWIKGRWRKSLSEEEFLLKGELRFEDKSPSSQTVQLGEKVCMRSTVAVVENAMTIIPEDIHFKWTFASSEGEEYKDIQVSDDRRVTCSTKPPNPTLIIRRANKDDKGYYKLTAMDKSKKNKRDLIFYLDVWGFKPTVDIIGGHSVTKGETASFVVLQSSYPEAFRIRWYKVEREDHTDFIKDETCIDITSEKYKGSTFDFLVINDVNNKDGGCYRVKVKNLIGEKSAFVHLFVRDGTPPG
ncbi:uncharacterized protein LOC134235565 [Saccostrea cucullata]|uniref:uncharacterized protein LOC134235565 n=1 Tax=Saccostrea cuccullata TaxID=36930 RepID=UPI002ED5292F